MKMIETMKEQEQEAILEFKKLQKANDELIS